MSSKKHNDELLRQAIWPQQFNQNNMDGVIKKIQEAIFEFNTKVQDIRKNDLTEPDGLKVFIKSDGSIGCNLDVETVKK